MLRWTPRKQPDFIVLMKIKCPECGKELYTNPFALTNKLECDKCNSKLVRNKESNAVLVLTYIVDMVIIGLVIPLVHYIYQDQRITSLFILMFLCEWMFELPQKALYRNGVLKFEKVDKDDN